MPQVQWVPLSPCGSKLLRIALREICRNRTLVSSLFWNWTMRPTDAKFMNCIVMSLVQFQKSEEPESIPTYFT